jgi:hypothetical protein
MTQQRSIFTGGFTTMLRHWPALVWTYVFNIGLAFLFTLPFHNQMSSLTSNSLASQRLIGGFDVGVAANVVGHISINQGSAAPASYLSIAVFVLIYFLLVPGTLFCYQTGAPARLSTLFQAGIAFFWRFVRVTLISLVAFAIVLGPLMAVNGAWQKHVDAHITGRSAVLHDLAALIVVGFIAAALRVYFDLVEVYTVALGERLRPGKVATELVPDRRVRLAFGPAWRAFTGGFFRIYSTFILLTLAGLCAVVLTAHVAMHTLAQPRMWPAFLLAQLGLFLMMLTRFWQRGAETVLALNAPLPEGPIILIETVEPEPAPDLV